MIVVFSRLLKNADSLYPFPGSDPEPPLYRCIVVASRGKHQASGFGHWNRQSIAERHAGTFPLFIDLFRSCALNIHTLTT